MSTLSDQLGLGASFRPGPFGWGEQTSPFPQGSQGEKFFNSLTSNEDKAAINTYVYRAKQKDPSSDGITGKSGILFALSNNPQYAAQALNYGPPRDSEGNVIPDRFVQGMQADTIRGVAGPSSGSNAFAQMLPFLTAYFLPGIGNAIAAQLVSAGVVTAGTTANALGLAIANTAAQVAQGKSFEDALKNVIVNTVVNTGSIEVAKAVNTVISNPAITDAVVSTASSMVKTAASGGSEADIANAGFAGLVQSGTTSAVKNVFNTSSDTANIFGAAAGGATTGGTTGAITSALNTVAGQLGRDSAQTKTDATTTPTPAPEPTPVATTDPFVNDINQIIEQGTSGIQTAGALPLSSYYSQSALNNSEQILRKVVEAANDPNYKVLLPKIQDALSRAGVTVSELASRLSPATLAVTLMTYSPNAGDPNEIANVAEKFRTFTGFDPTTTLQTESAKITQPKRPITPTPVESSDVVTPIPSTQISSTELGQLPPDDAPLLDLIAQQPVVPQPVTEVTAETPPAPVTSPDREILELIAPTITPTPEPAPYTPNISVASPVVTPTVAPTPTPTPIPPAPAPTPAPAPEPIPAPVPTPAPAPEPALAPSPAPEPIPEQDRAILELINPTPAPVLTPEIAPTVAPIVTPTTAPEVTPVISPEVAPTIAPEIAPIVSPAPSTSPITSPETSPATEPVARPALEPATKNVIEGPSTTLISPVLTTPEPLVPLTDDEKILKLITPELEPPPISKPTVTPEPISEPTPTTPPSTKDTSKDKVPADKEKPYQPKIVTKTIVTPKKPPASPTSVLGQALGTTGLTASRGAGEIEDTSTGKKRKKVWNEETLRLKDALGV